MLDVLEHGVDPVASSRKPPSVLTKDEVISMHVPSAIEIRPCSYLRNFAEIAVWKELSR